MNKFIAFSIAAFLTIGSAVAKDIQVKGYTRKDGTKVAGYTRHIKDKDTTSAPAAASTKKDDTKVTNSTKPAGAKVAGYTKKNGTKVAGYTKKAKSK